MRLRSAGITVVAQVYTPDLLIAELKGPLTIGEQGRPPALIANWKLAESSVRGLPTVPQRISMVWDEPVVSHLRDNVQVPLFRAMRTEVHGRLGPDSQPDRPVIEIVTRINRGAVQDFHPLLAQPFDSAMTAQLRGLRDISPKPWPARFREIQAAGGRIDIVVQSRFEQGRPDRASHGGSLGFASGRLDGELKMTVVGMRQCEPGSRYRSHAGRGRAAKSGRIAPGVKSRGYHQGARRARSRHSRARPGGHIGTPTPASPPASMRWARKPCWKARRPAPSRCASSTARCFSAR